MTINADMNAQLYRVRNQEAPQRPGWTYIPQDVKDAFLDKKYRIVTVPAGTRLYKMTMYEFPKEKWKTLSAWWAPVEPFFDDTDGALLRFKEAAYNGVSISDYIRVASAVSADFNELGKYQEIRLREDAKGMWGQFQPMPMASTVAKIMKNKGYSRQEAEKFRAERLAVALKTLPHLPETLGGLGAWQLWIPNLTGNDVDETCFHDNVDVQVSQLFHIDLPAPHPFVRP